MNNIFTLFIAFFSCSMFFAQDLSDAKITEELTNWDAVRGPWLAQSMSAIATDKPIPDRNFPEEFTPAEMYSKVPTERQKVIQSRINENTQSAPELQRTSWNRMNNFVSRSSCQLTMARTYGDPHISSFDGKNFSFQTAGEFVMARSSDGTVEVQARQKPQSDEISLNTAVAMNVHGDRVGIYASDFPDGNSSTPIRVSGQAVNINNGMYYLPHGGTIENTGSTYTVTWPTGEKVQAKMSRTGGMQFMNLSVHVFPCSSMYNGVLGNANGNPNDDFGSSRSSMASSSVFDPFGSRDLSTANTNQERQYLSFLANDFAREFRVTQTTSLFDYGFGQSTWSFTDESFPRVHLTLADMSSTNRSNAQRICEQQGISRNDMAACIFDVGHANIQPSPTPVVVDRTHNRPLPTVDGRTPNVNNNNGGRVLGTSVEDVNVPGRSTPSTKPTVLKSEDVQAKPKTSEPQPIQPIGNGSSTTKGTTETIDPGTSGKPVKKSVFTTSTTETVKPAEPVPAKPTPVVTKQPVEHTAPPVNNPQPRSTPKPSPVIHSTPSSTPAPAHPTPVIKAPSGGTVAPTRPR